MTPSPVVPSIADFIRDEVLAPRLKVTGCLVVYDRERRYRDLCLHLADEKCVVVDASESSLDCREAASLALRAVGDRNSSLERLLVYVPVAAPVTPEEKQVDPFSVYAVCGSVFPQGDADDYEALCLRARPDHATEIRRVFEQDASPSFATIDAIGGGTGWPQLKTLLHADSVSGILKAVLAPNRSQKEALEAGGAWAAEIRDLCRASLGLELRTRSRAWEPVAAEAWRFLLFSELAFRLGEEPPASLAGVPRASQAAAPLVRHLCDDLRDHLRTQETYVNRAREVQEELGLEAALAGATAFTPGETFPFEERLLFARAARALHEGRFDAVREEIVRGGEGLWRKQEEYRLQWFFMECALDLLARCEDLERDLPDHTRSQDALIDFYTGSLREADRLHREMEQAYREFPDADETLRQVVDKAHDGYRGLVTRTQGHFIRLLEASGWPPPGNRLSNDGVYDRFLAPHLQESGRRVAFILVDALRYELGIELEKRLAADFPVEVHATCALLPSITPVGMASLLPGAAADLRLVLDGENLVPTLGSTPVRNVAERMDVLRRLYGDRFAHMTMREFLDSRKLTSQKTVQLLVLRSVDIDGQMESLPDSGLPLILQELKRVRAALLKLQQLGFQHAVIATDHGFFLNMQAEPGDVCARPSGNWPCVKDRSMLGQGAADAHNLVLPADRAGIRGDIPAYACPRSLAPYVRGVRYFHSGASLQELIVPVLVVRLGTIETGVGQRLTISIRYKGGRTKKITSRLPVIDVMVEQGDLFTQEGKAVEFLIEAQDAKGNVVGEVRPGTAVNPANGHVAVAVRSEARVTLRMLSTFEGPFKVKAINPDTFTCHCELALETDYVDV